MKFQFQLQVNRVLILSQAGPFEGASMQFVLIGISFLVSVWAFAFDGAVSGGGGRSVVCRDGKKILSAQLLDLFEAEQIFGLQFEPEKKSYEEEVDWIINKIKLGRHQIQITQFDIHTKFTSKIHFVGDGLELTPIEDSFEPLVPTNCKVEQVANYHQSGLILIKEEIWNAFSTMNKAALLIHELAYLEARTRGPLESSYYVRRFVGFMFSTSQLRPFVAPASTKPYRHCSNPDAFSGLNFAYEFYVLPMTCPYDVQPPENCYRVVFSYLDGQMVYDQTELEFLGAKQLGNALDPSVPFSAFSSKPAIKSQIFDGSYFHFTVLDQQGERIPKVSLFDNTDKEFVDLKCELLQPNQQQPTLHPKRN